MNVVTAIIIGSSNNLKGITDYRVNGNWYTKTEAITAVETGANWVVGTLTGPKVTVATHNGIKYLKSNPNDETNDNLLNLPRL